MTDSETRTPDRGGAPGIYDDMRAALGRLVSGFSGQLEAAE